jgi:HAD superfamily hydrolase (TIGR01509 family)
VVEHAPFIASCLVLDFDGTILDTEASSYRTWYEFWDAHGQQLDLAEWQATIGTDGAFDPWEELQRRLGRRLDRACFAEIRARRDELLAAQDGPRPGVLAWLDDARRLGVPVGVASSSPSRWVERHLDRLGLRERFGFLACCEGDGAVPAKPDPTSYRLACERLGAHPHLSVAVEDSPHGVTAAVAAGLYTVAVPHPLTETLDLSAADLIAGSLVDLTLADALATARAPLRPRPSGGTA